MFTHPKFQNVDMAIYHPMLISPTLLTHVYSNNRKYAETNFSSSPKFAVEKEKK